MKQKIRYWDDDLGGWATGYSTWDGRLLPQDNSGWQQKEVLLGQGDRAVGQYITPYESRGKATPDMTLWRKSSGVSEYAPSVVSCPCGKKLNMREAKLRLRRCQKCRDENRRIGKPKTRTRAAALPFEEVA